jgi:hypothetical protein
MALKFVQTPPIYLYQGLSASATSMIISPYPRDIQTNTKLTYSDFGTTPTVTVDPKVTGYEEIISFTGITDNGDDTATLTGLTRNLIGQSPYTTPGTGKTHGASATVVFSDNPQMWARLAAMENDNSFTGLQTFTQLPVSTGGNATSGTQLITYAQALALATGTASINRVVVAGTAGATITIGQTVYLDTADQKWKLTDADTAGTVNNVIKGIAQGAGTNGNPITNGVLLFGLDSNQTGMTVGTQYFSNTAGALSNSAGTIEVTAGEAISATEIIFYAQFNQQLTEDQQDALDQALGGALSFSNPVISLNGTSTTATADKIAKRLASGGLTVPTTPSNSTDATSKAYVDGYEYVSGENLTANKPVYINPSDSSVYTAHGFKELDSTSLNVTVSTSSKMSKLSDTQMMFLTHATNTLTITVYDINSGSSVATQTVTTSFDPDTASSTLPAASVTRLSNTTFIVFYARTTDSNLYFRTGSISGGTITMDTETAYSGTPSFVFGIDSCPGGEDGKVVLTYQDSTNAVGSSATVVNVLAYLTCSTNTATVTYTVSSTSFTSGVYFASPVWSVAQFTRGVAYGLFCTSDSGGIRTISYSLIDANSGTTKTDIPTINLELPTGAGTSAAYTQYRPFVVGHNGKIYFGYRIMVNGSATHSILEADTSGCTVFYQYSAISSNGFTTNFAIPMFGNEMGVIVARLPNSNSNSSVYDSTLYFQKDKIYGFIKSSTLGISSDFPQFSAWYSNTKDEIVVCYANSSGYVKQWKLPTLLDGIVTSSVTAPATATIFDTTATISGLTANAKYFLKDTYTTIGDIDTTGTIPIGNALSTTVIKFDK